MRGHRSFIRQFATITGNTMKKKILASTCVLGFLAAAQMASADPLLQQDLHVQGTAPGGCSISNINATLMDFGTLTDSAGFLRADGVDDTRPLANVHCNFAVKMRLESAGGALKKNGVSTCTLAGQWANCVKYDAMFNWGSQTGTIHADGTAGLVHATSTGTSGAYSDMVEVTVTLTGPSTSRLAEGTYTDILTLKVAQTF